MKRIARREFLGGLGGLGVLSLTGCAGASVAQRSVDLNPSTNFTMLNWELYIDPSEGQPGTIEQFAIQTGITGDYREEYTDNVSGYELISRAIDAGAPNEYDIVVPTNWVAAQMIEQGLAQPLPIEVIPNHVNLDPAYMTNSWDRGSRYQMPWQAGITGIAYDPALTGRALSSVNDLFDPEFAGRVGFIVEMREAVGLAMLANGDDPSRPTTAAATAGLERIVEAVSAGQVGAFTANEFADRLASGELVAAMAWSGDTALLRAERPDIEFVIPDEGAIRWFDTMVIPKGAYNLSAAGLFMNFVYDPKQAANITEYVQYISPVLGVQEELFARGGDAAVLAADPVLFPDEVTRSRLFTWGGLPLDDEAILEAAYEQLMA